jgi:hypothetical protein
MLKQLPIKKEYLLVIAAVVLFLVCYQLAFKKTVAAWQINRQLKAQILQTSDLSYQPAYLERKNANLGKLIARFRTDTIAFRSNVISTISVIADKEHVKLSEVPGQNPQYHSEAFIIQKLSFEGDFFALLKVLHQLQDLNGVGMVRSAAFKSLEIHSTSAPAKKLVLEVYLEIVT